MPIQTFGATFSPADRAMIASRVPSTGRQSTFSRADDAFIARDLPPYASSTLRRFETGAVQAGYASQGVDYAGRPGITPRAIHALNARREPSNQGASVARRAGEQAVLNGFYGVAGLGGACTSTALNVSGGIMAGSGSMLSTYGASVTGSTVTSPDGVSKVLPLTLQQQRTQIATTTTGALLQMTTAIMGSVCQAQTGTVPPGITTGASAGAAASALYAGITASRAAELAATQPGVAPLPAVSPPATQPAPDNTMLYVGGGIAALVVVLLVMK